jgi:hypothetical protein
MIHENSTPLANSIHILQSFQGQMMQLKTVAYKLCLHYHNRMTKRDKLLNKFLSKPKDFTWQELIRFLGGFGYELVATGKTGGSRARFVHPDYPPITLHKPHPRPILKQYQVEAIIGLLKQEGLL